MSDIICEGQMSGLFPVAFVMDKEGQPTDRIDVLDFNAGTALTTDLGKDFDESRGSDPHVARSVVHFIKSQGKMVIIKKTDVLSVRLQAAFYEKKLLRSVQLNIFSTDLRINPLSPDLIREGVASDPAYWWGAPAPLATVNLFDVSITNFHTQNFITMGIDRKFVTMGIDIIMLAASSSGERIPDWSDYSNR
jgi:hypothetical protein